MPVFIIHCLRNIVLCEELTSLFRSACMTIIHITIPIFYRCNITTVYYHFPNAVSLNSVSKVILMAAATKAKTLDRTIRLATMLNDATPRNASKIEKVI
jgi:hypothetical protein